MTHLGYIVDELANSGAVQDKIQIRRSFAPALAGSADSGLLGDDCAAIREADGNYLLFAAEGLLDSFVRDDPWFAGYSAVMVNISDICAMGGRPTAIVDVIWTPDYERSEMIWEGMNSAAEDYGVPVVGGHTTITRDDGPVRLAAAIIGRAKRLMTSFDARPADTLLMVVDLNGSYRGDKPFWCATLDTPSSTLKEYIELLPQLAENGWCKAAKDISNGGLVGTLIMLLECSGVGAKLSLDELPMPSDVDLPKWLVSFPSFGYLLSVSSDMRDTVIRFFADHNLCCKKIGEITSNPTLELTLGSERQIFWQQPSSGDRNASA
jgi:AIR synthase-related protein